MLTNAESSKIRKEVKRRNDEAMAKMKPEEDDFDPTNSTHPDSLAGRSQG